MKFRVQITPSDSIVAEEHGIRPIVAAFCREGGLDPEKVAKGRKVGAPPSYHQGLGDGEVDSH